MLWKLYLGSDANPEMHQWDELLGKSPWDFVAAPNWPGTDMEDPWDFSNRYLEPPLDEEETHEPTLPEVEPENGKWEINPITGVKIWIPYK